MIGRAVLLCCVGSAAFASELIAVPSGQPVVFQEVVTDAPGVGLAYRFRFVAPELKQGTDYAIAEADMAHLCETYALPRLAEIGPQPAQIVISLADRALDFATSDPDTVQFFEAYKPENGRCIWEFH